MQNLLSYDLLRLSLHWHRRLEDQTEHFLQRRDYNRINQIEYHSDQPFYPSYDKERRKRLRKVGMLSLCRNNLFRQKLIGLTACLSNNCRTRTLSTASLSITSLGRNKPIRNQYNIGYRQYIRNILFQY